MYCDGLLNAGSISDITVERGTGGFLDSVLLDSAPVDGSNLPFNRQDGAG
jgi:hypothetical protein